MLKVVMKLFAAAVLTLLLSAVLLARNISDGLGETRVQNGDWDTSVNTGFHRPSGGPGTEAKGQPHPLSWGTRSKPSMARAGHSSKTGQKCEANLRYGSPLTRRASCRYDLGSTTETCVQYRHRGMQPLRESIRVITCIEDQYIIDRILAHLCRKEQDAPPLPLLVPPIRAPPITLPLFSGTDFASTQFNQHGRH